MLQEFYLKVDRDFLFSLKEWYDSTLDTDKNSFYSVSV